MKTRTFIISVVAVLALATVLRTAWLTADPPPATSSPGIVWHDEGAWVHNARNRALFGVWRTDEWNPVFIAPIFTALEYLAFRSFGVGTWQARTVPVASGLVAILCLIVGLRACAGRAAALLGGALLATSYFFVMWNRAALMESTMTAFMVVAWMAYALSERRPLWGLVAGVAAVLAYFTKAVAVAFVAAIALDALFTLVRPLLPGQRGEARAASAAETRAAWMTLAGLAAAALAIAAVFVLPHWADYHFYNVTVALDRKPSYGLRDLIDRASNLPIDKDVLGSMWPELLGAAFALFAIVSRWHTTTPSRRLLVLWLLIGVAELIVYDVTNDRRFVMLVPAIVALASLVPAAAEPLLPTSAVTAPMRARLLVWPLVLFVLYIVAGSLIRLPFLDAVHARHLSIPVRLSAAAALLAGLWLWWRWRTAAARLAQWRAPASVVGVLVIVMVAWDLGQYAMWAGSRTDLNYRASIALGRLLPPDTLVQGKLANGLDLENRIRPLFIGNHFGNYDDRLERDDVRYILTYVLPEVGYESQQSGTFIQQLLDKYPRRSVVATFDVRETPGRDRAALFDKHARD